MLAMIGIDIVTLETVWHGSKLLDISLDPGVFCETPEVGQKVIIDSEEHEITELKWVDYAGQLVPMFFIGTLACDYSPQTVQEWQKLGFTFTHEGIPA